jgi:SAM-dependent methyltransferase
MLEIQYPPIPATVPPAPVNYNVAASFCKGRGLEIGALSNPAPLQAEVVYADVCDKSAMTAVLCSLEGGPYYDLEKLIEPDLILQPPHFYIPFANEELDFVYSSHVLEHTPNIIAALYDQLRCVKAGGVIYFVVPDRRGTYDHRRPATPLSVFIRRFEDRSFTFSLEEASELLWGTTGHAHYAEKTPSKLNEIHAGGSPAHHFFVLSPASVIDLLQYVTGRFNCELVYFCAADLVNIQVCLKKLGPSRV